MWQQDVDQLFGVILALILRKHHFEEPAELMQYVQTSLSERFRLKGESLIVEEMSAVRDFDAWPMYTRHQLGLARRHEEEAGSGRVHVR